MAAAPVRTGRVIVGRLVLAVLVRLLKVVLVLAVPELDELLVVRLVAFEVGVVLVLVLVLVLLVEEVLVVLIDVSVLGLTEPWAATAKTAIKSKLLIFIPLYNLCCVYYSRLMTFVCLAWR